MNFRNNKNTFLKFKNVLLRRQINKKLGVKTDKTKWTGYITGVIAIIFYAIINILSQKAGELQSLDTLIFAAIFVTIKELTTIITYFIFGFNPLKRYRELLHAFRINKRSSLLAMIAGTFGGAIGFTLTTAGGIYVGSGLAAPFYSIEIIIVLASVRVLFKRKPNIHQIISISLISLVVILLPIFNEVSSSDKIESDSIIGIILVTLGVFCWAIEALIFDKISEDPNVNIRTFVAFKQIASFIFAFIIIIPMFSLMKENKFESGYIGIGKMFSQFWESLLLAIFAGVLLYVGRFYFFTSTKYVGATMSNAIYNLLTVVQIPISFISKAIDPSVDYVGYIHHEYFWILSFVLVLSILYSIYGQFQFKDKL